MNNSRTFFWGIVPSCLRRWQQERTPSLQRTENTKHEGTDAFSPVEAKQKNMRFCSYVILFTQEGKFCRHCGVLLSLLLFLLEICINMFKSAVVESN